MKTYKISKIVKGLIFDVDKTLYDNDEYAEYQIDILIDQLEKHHKWDKGTGKKRVNEFRNNYKKENNGKSISLGNTFLNFNIPMEQSVKWRNRLIEPSKFLKKNKQLGTELNLLSKSYKIIALTNNPKEIGLKSINAIGISDYFLNIIGLDDTLHSKPD